MGEWLLKGEVAPVMATDALEVERAFKVALWCAQARPTMRTVILMLEGHVEVPFPPPPATSS